jgi:putative FmdB family regulatory protein
LIFALRIHILLKILKTLRAIPMPIYEYRCDDCGHEMEVIQKMSDDPLSDCPSCNGRGLRKLVSAGAFQIKGSGWYATDFKNGGGKKPEPKSDTAGGCSTGTCPATAAAG